MKKIPVSKKLEALVGGLLNYQGPWRPLFLPDPESGRRSCVFHSNIVLNRNDLVVILSLDDAFWDKDYDRVCGVKILHPGVGVAWIDYVFEDLDLNDLIIVKNEEEE